MSEELGREFAARVAAADERLSAVTEQQAAQSYRAGGWLRKQVLGHLLDSAANNEQRFVRAALYGEYACPGYEQEAWVAIHGYAGMSWTELLAAWRSSNAQLVRVVQRIEPARLSAPVTLGAKPPVTLEWVIKDYWRHLDQHVAQIAGGA